jgi:hypothetical protein
MSKPESDNHDRSPSSHLTTTSHVVKLAALTTLTESFSRFSGNPAILHFSTNSQSLVIYVAATRTINIINLSLLCTEAGSGQATKDFLKKTKMTTKEFFDARTSAKVLFERCGIRLADPVHSRGFTSLIVPSRMYRASPHP